MAQGIFKNGEHINLTYHAAGDASGLTPTGLVYDEAAATHVVESTALCSSLALGEKVGGVYMGGFQPDAEGVWTVVIDDGTGDGTAVATYRVCGFNIDSVGDSIPSQLLITKSALVSSILADCNASTSDVKSAVIAQASDVKSAVLAVSTPAAIS